MAVTTIAIIGASGKIGSAIAERLSEGAYRLLLVSRDAVKLAGLQSLLGKKANADFEVIDCAVNGCWEADIIVLAVPHSAEKVVAEKVRQVATGKIVISVSNVFTGIDGSAEEPQTEALLEVLPHSIVINAFNTIAAADFEAAGRRQNQQVSFEGNDREAVQTIIEVVNAAEWKTSATGNLPSSRKLEKEQA